MSDGILSDPGVQYGFAGMCAALLGILCWLGRRLIELLSETLKVIDGNTAALERLSLEQERWLQSCTDLRERLLSRPCLQRPQERAAAFNRKAIHLPERLDGLRETQIRNTAKTERLPSRQKSGKENR